MTQEPASTVRITFETPPRANLPRSSSFHERCLEGVPEPTAQQMIRDFEAYEEEPSAATRQKLYTYQPAKREETSDDEALVALDFGEIVTLQVSVKQPAL